MKTPEIPKTARVVRTYADLRQYLDEFARGLRRFVWLLGRPGVAKSESVKAALARCPRFYYRPGGQLTPLQFYIDLYQHRDQPIVLDDAEHLLDHEVGFKLISALGDTAPRRLLTYGSRSTALDGTPLMFDTESPLCIISNRPTPHEAIRSRALVLYFDPSNSEIHADAASWFWDQQIHDWFGQHLSRVARLESRWYLRCYEDKRAGRDWARLALADYVQPNDRPSVVVQDLEHDASCPNPEDKARRFAEIFAAAKGGSRATYHRVRKALRDKGQLDIEAAPRILLRHTSPPAAPSPLEGGAPPGPSPAHAAFATPVTGSGAGGPPPAQLDDTVAFEQPPGGQEDEGAP
jgi:hypothetical protein